MIYPFPEVLQQIILLTGICMIQAEKKGKLGWDLWPSKRARGYNGTRSAQQHIPKGVPFKVGAIMPRLKLLLSNARSSSESA